MTFLNAILAGGAAAGLIPVLIYLFNRHRYRVVKWGAMHLLDSVVLVNRRRIRLEQLLLLLVRISIPVLLALALARPVLTGMRRLVGGAKSSAIVLLDNSYSMEAGDSVRTNFTAAKEIVNGVLDSLPPGSEACVLGMAGSLPPGAETPASDLDLVRRAMAGAEGGFGLADVPRSLESAAGVLASRMNNADRVLLVTSDFQCVSWGKEGAPARRRSLELLKSLKVPPQIYLLPAGKEIKDNIAVESLQLSRPLVGVRQPVRIRANLHNYGASPVPDLRVYFKVDGKEKGVSQISLGGGERGQVLFTHEFDKAGSHVLEVSTDADALRADNSCLISLPVVDAIPVLIVSGDPNPEPLRGETAFLEIALQPFGAGKSGLADLLSTKVCREEELSAQRLAECRVVILANVRQLMNDQLFALENFVRDGNGLLLFPGDRANAAWYNSALVKDGRGVLPYNLTALAGSVRTGDKPAAIVVRHFEHPALDIFNDPRTGSLGGAEIQAWYRLARPAAVQADAAATSVLASLDSGDPLLVERAFGEGLVIQASVPCDADWSNLPVRPFYLPLMQELTTHLAAKVYPPRNIEVGQALSLFLPAEDAEKTVTVVDPLGKRHPMPVAKRGIRGVLEFKDTSRPGLYQVETPRGETIHIVATTSRRESDPARLDAAVLKELAVEMNAKLVPSVSEFQDAEKKRRVGQELWPLLLWCAVGMMFVELLLEQWIARRQAVPTASSATTRIIHHEDTKNTKYSKN